MTTEEKEGFTWDKILAICFLTNLLTALSRFDKFLEIMDLVEFQRRSLLGIDLWEGRA